MVSESHAAAKKNSPGSIEMENWHFLKGTFTLALLNNYPLKDVKKKIIIIEKFHILKGS